MKKIITVTGCFFLIAYSYAQAPVFQWVQQMRGLGDGFGTAVTTDAAGNIYTTGYYYGTVDFNPGSPTYNLTAIGGNEDVFISKLDAAGNFIWAKSIGGGQSDRSTAIAVDVSGNIFITGAFTGTSDFDPGTPLVNLSAAGSPPVHTDVFISKLDAAGNFVWAKVMGGPLNDSPTAISVDPQGNVYTTGHFLDTADFDPGTGTFNLVSAGDNDVFISKLNAAGNFVWAKSIGGVSDDSGNGITTDAGGNVYTTGYFSGTTDFDPGAGTFNLTCTGPYSATSDIFISKLDATGNFVWAKSIGGNSNDMGNAIALDAADNVYTTGMFWGTADFDPGAGITNLNTASLMDPNSYILKLDTAGNFIWATNTAAQGGHAIALDAADNVYTVGTFRGTVDFDPGAGTTNLTGLDTLSTDTFYSKSDPAGNFIWATATTGNLSVNGFSVDAPGDIYSTGRFDNIVDFNFGTGVFALASPVSTNIFVHKMGQTYAGINENENPAHIIIYPNPTNNVFNISISTPSKNNTVEVYNSTGSLVYQQKIANELSTIDLNNNANGIYFVRVLSDTKVIATEKIVKR